VNMYGIPYIRSLMGEGVGQHVESRALCILTGCTAPFSSYQKFSTLPGMYNTLAIIPTQLGE